MSKLFGEEQEVLNALLAEWYEEIHSFTQDADGIFSEKGKMYDRTSPVWERVRFPYGFVQELRKKTDRVDQLLEPYETGKVTWEDVLEELGDILNYSRMFGALIVMYLSRAEPRLEPLSLSKEYLNGVEPKQERLPQDYLNGDGDAERARQREHEWEVSIQQVDELMAAMSPTGKESC